MRVFDVCMYNGEAEMLKARVRELAPHVDVFVVAEAPFTFSGEPKRLTFEDVHLEVEAIACAFACGIRPTPIIHFEEVGDPGPLDARECARLWPLSPMPLAWARESHCRSWPARYVLAEAARDDLVVFADCDEVPDFGATPPAELASRTAKSPLLLTQDFYYYNFGCKKSYPWSGPLVFRPAQLAVADGWRVPRRVRAGRTTPQHWRDRRAILPHAHSGWHMSYFMPPAEIARKLGAFSHQEFNTAQFRDEGEICRRIAAREDLFSRGAHEKCVPPGDSVPLPRTYDLLPEYMKNPADLVCAARR